MHDAGLGELCLAAGHSPVSVVADQVTGRAGATGWSVVVEAGKCGADRCGAVGIADLTFTLSNVDLLGTNALNFGASLFTQVAIYYNGTACCFGMEKVFLDRLRL